MRGKVALGLVVAVVAAGGAFAGVAASPSFKPPCPAASYSPDGNFSPIFCKIANPQALAFYGKLMPPLFRLGPAASPSSSLDRDKATRPTSPGQSCALLRGRIRMKGPVR